MPPGYEPESEWHLTWKECIRDENCEVIFGDNSEHRADIVGDSDTVIEIQRSIIDIRESRERVRFYKENTGKRVVWVVDIQEIWRKTFKLSGKKDDKGNLIIDWKPKRTWLWDLAQTTDTNLFLEFNQKNDKLLQAWVHNKILKAKFVSKKDFFSRYMKSVAKPEYQENVDSAVDVLTGIA
ncbi:hypothetical protein JCM19235_2456 [Vibrio maritimus]|uniref:Competence protein CoiA nuclease-like domain-containing protein n=1 Tax=Vibrio maritimus TaxID=990268 RepID=A0A090RWW8_9VIBR|nr:hypothetical protein JCM19235_2456 [Vibrio maritimus]